MSKPTVNQVLTDARLHLGDPYAQVFSDQALTPFFGMAYRRLIQALSRYEIPRGENEAYPVIPANTNVFYPDAYGITDFSEIVSMDERGGVTEVAISGVSNATPVVVTTSTDHGISNGEEIEIYGVVGPISVNWRWIATVLTNTTFGLNGSQAAGAYTSGGKVVRSSAAWNRVTPVERIAGELPPQQQIRQYGWINNRIVLTPSVEARQLRVVYTVSEDPPSSGTIGVNNSRNYLALQTAAFAAPPYDMESVADRCEVLALGPQREANGSGGALRELLNPMILALQKTPARVASFRSRRQADAVLL